MKEFLDNYLDKIIAVVVILGVSFILNKIIDVLISRTIKTKKKKNITTLLMFVKRIKKAVIYSLAVLVCLTLFDVFNSFSVTLLSGLGIGSVVIGLAAQESLKNFFGSVAIVAGNPYEVGDFIECIDKGVSGTVEDITMRHTVIKTTNNRRVIIPNSEMNTYTIENFNYSDENITNDNGMRFINNEVLITFNSNVKESRCKEIINEINGNIISSLGSIKQYEVQVNYKFTTYSAIEQFCEMLQEKYDEIMYVSANMLYEMNLN